MRTENIHVINATFYKSVVYAVFTEKFKLLLNSRITLTFVENTRVIQSYTEFYRVIQTAEYIYRQNFVLASHNNVLTSQENPHLENSVHNKH